MTPAPTPVAAVAASAAAASAHCAAKRHAPSADDSARHTILDHHFLLDASLGQPGLSSCPANKAQHASASGDEHAGDARRLAALACSSPLSACTSLAATPRPASMASHPSSPHASSPVSSSNAESALCQALGLAAPRKAPGASLVSRMLKKHLRPLEPVHPARQPATAPASKVIGSRAPGSRAKVPQATGVGPVASLQLMPGARLQSQGSDAGSRSTTFPPSNSEAFVLIPPATAVKTVTQTVVVLDGRITLAAASPQAAVEIDCAEHRCAAGRPIGAGGLLLAHEQPDSNSMQSGSGAVAASAYDTVHCKLACRAEDREVSMQGAIQLQRKSSGRSKQSKQLHQDPPGDSLLAALRIWRQGRARQAGKQPSSVLSDQVLQALAQQQPLTFTELQRVPGLTSARAQRLGQELLDLMRAHAYTAAASATVQRVSTAAHKAPHSSETAPAPCAVGGTVANAASVSNVVDASGCLPLPGQAEGSSSVATVPCVSLSSCPTAACIAAGLNRLSSGCTQAAAETLCQVATASGKSSGSPICLPVPLALRSDADTQLQQQASSSFSQDAQPGTGITPSSAQGSQVPRASSAGAGCSTRHCVIVAQAPKAAVCDAGVTAAASSSRASCMLPSIAAGVQQGRDQEDQGQQLQQQMQQQQSCEQQQQQHREGDLHHGPQQLVATETCDGGQPSAAAACQVTCHVQFAAGREGKRSLAHSTAGADEEVSRAVVGRKRARRSGSCSLSEAGAASCTEHKAEGSQLAVASAAAQVGTPATAAVKSGAPQGLAHSLLPAFDAAAFFAASIKSPTAVFRAGTTAGNRRHAPGSRQVPSGGSGGSKVRVLASAAGLSEPGSAKRKVRMKRSAAGSRKGLLRSIAGSGELAARGSTVAAHKSDTAGRQSAAMTMVAPDRSYVVQAAAVYATDAASDPRMRGIGQHAGSSEVGEETHAATASPPLLPAMPQGTLAGAAGLLPALATTAAAADSSCSPGEMQQGGEAASCAADAGQAQGAGSCCEPEGLSLLPTAIPEVEHNTRGEAMPAGLEIESSKAGAPGSGVTPGGLPEQVPAVRAKRRRKNGEAAVGSAKVSLVVPVPESFLHRTVDASLKQYSKEEDRWILQQVAAGMPEAQVAAILRRSHNAVVRRVRLLIARATAPVPWLPSQHCHARGQALSQPVAGETEAVAQSSEAARPSSGAQEEALTAACAAGAAPGATIGPQVQQGGAESPAQLPTQPPRGKRLAAAEPESVEGAKPAVDMDEAAAVHAILRARAAAAQARDSVSLPPHLLTPLIWCLQSGADSSTSGLGPSTPEASECKMADVAP